MESLLEGQETTGKFQDVVLSKVQSLLFVVLKKTTKYYPSELDAKSQFNQMKNIFCYLDECAYKIANINLKKSAKINLESSYLADGGFECINETCKTIKYNLKLNRKKVNKLKLKNAELKSKLADERFKSKVLLKMTKYLASKYYENEQEINDKVAEIENFQEKNLQLEADLENMIAKMNVIRECSTFAENTQ